MSVVTQARQFCFIYVHCCSLFNVNATDGLSVCCLVVLVAASRLGGYLVYCSVVFVEYSCVFSFFRDLIYTCSYTSIYSV